MMITLIFSKNELNYLISKYGVKLSSAFGNLGLGREYEGEGNDIRKALLDGGILEIVDDKVITSVGTDAILGLLSAAETFITVTKHEKGTSIFTHFAGTGQTLFQIIPEGDSIGFYFPFDEKMIHGAYAGLFPETDSPYFELAFSPWEYILFTRLVESAGEGKTEFQTGDIESFFSSPDDTLTRLKEIFSIEDEYPPSDILSGIYTKGLIEEGSDGQILLTDLFKRIAGVLNFKRYLTLTRKDLEIEHVNIRETLFYYSENESIAQAFLHGNPPKVLLFSLSSDLAFTLIGDTILSAESLSEILSGVYKDLTGEVLSPKKADKDAKIKKAKKTKKVRTKKKKKHHFLRFLVFIVVLCAVILGFHFTLGPRLIAKAIIKNAGKDIKFLAPAINIKEGIYDMAEAMGRHGINTGDIDNVVEQIDYDDIVYYIEEFRDNDPNIGAAVDILFSRVDHNTTDVVKFKKVMMKYIPVKDLENAMAEMGKLEGIKLKAALPVFKELILESLKEYSKEKE
ncbi:hypothetical protein KAU32_01390 [bacterium]|nr:hypothetical protein [bacterium]